ncbi:MAG: hypothetical protein LAN62_02135 [Acidobacteriia bacterium]|nr:hypothetical protein [Terriglobia bacterium]
MSDVFYDAATAAYNAGYHAVTGTLSPFEMAALTPEQKAAAAQPQKESEQSNLNWVLWAVVGVVALYIVLR